LTIFIEELGANFESDLRKVVSIMGSKGYPETWYLLYNITQCLNPKVLQHPFHLVESLRSHLSLLYVYSFIDLVGRYKMLILVFFWN